MLSPWITNSLIDTCAFDPKYSPEHEAAQELSELWNRKSLPLLIAHSTKKELEHPNTPKWVKAEAAARIYSVQTQRTSAETAILKKIHKLLTGNAGSKKHAQDAQHVFEAHKYGSYFVTTDRRILEKAAKISEVADVVVLLPSTFLKLVREYEA